MLLAATRRAAVQVVMLASAGLSAIYYASQAPAFEVRAFGYPLELFAVAVGITAFALDLVKPEMLRIAATRGQTTGQRMAAALLFAVLFIASMAAIDGLLMRFRSDWAAGRSNAISAYENVAREVQSLEAELASLGEPRPVSVINAEVAAAPIPMRIWRASKQCEDITLEDSRTACEPILALYKERGAAARKAELEPRFIEAKAKRDRMEPPKAADPQAEALARLSGFSPDVVAYLMVAIIGLVVELTACLGVWVLTHPNPSHQATAPSDEIECKVPGPVAGLDRIVREIIANGGQFVAENADLAKVLGVSPSCASKWRKAWREAGDIIEARRDGSLVLSLGRQRIKLIHAG